MSHPYESAAVRILDWLHHAERDLVGATVATFNGEAGTVQAVRLDEHHGLCFTVDDPDPRVIGRDFNGPKRRYYPVSTIRMKS